MNARTLAIIVATCASLGGAQFGPDWLGLPLAVLLVAVLPGAGIAEALFAWRAEPAERLVASLGLSFVVVILGGLLLAVTVGITQHSIEILLGGTAIVAALAGAFARRRSPAPPTPPREHLRMRTAVQIVVFVLAGIIVAGAIGYARTPAGAKGVKGYSVLWVAPTPGRAKIGVESEELSAMSYQVKVAFGTRTTRTWQLTLAPGARWHSTILRKRGAGTLNAKLYRRQAGAWVEYRRVRAVA